MSLPYSHTFQRDTHQADSSKYVFSHNYGILDFSFHTKWNSEKFVFSRDLLSGTKFDNEDNTKNNTLWMLGIPEDAF